MAALDMHEQEQVEALKSWWKENGKWVVIALVLGLSAFAAIRGWQIYQSKQSADAAMLYAEVVKQIGSNDAKRVNDAAAALVSKYGSTSYAARAQLLAAQVNIQIKDSALAKTQLQWVIDQVAEEGMQNAARLKLAGLLLDEKNYDGALRLLDALRSETYAGLYADLKGDVLNAQGKTAEARTAYQQALEKTEAKSNYRNLIQLKLDGLGAAK
jgi:predicted negative regulator of RcsB-dependent stress response